MDAAEVLRVYRRKRGLTQEALAELLNERLDRKYDKARISRWESGKEDVPALVREYLVKKTRAEARIIAVANQKGGVAKTTSAISLAYSLAVMGYRVLLVDADPQGNASLGCGVDLHQAMECGATLSPLLTTDHDDLRPLVLDNLHELNGFSVLAGGLDLSKFEAVALTLPGYEKRLKFVLDAVRTDYDYILIDTPPNLGVMTRNALVSATEVLIPCATAPMDVTGIALLLETIGRIRRYENHDLQVTGILPTKHDGRNAVEKAVLEKLHEEYAGKLRLFTPIKKATAFDQATWNGVIAVQAMPDSHFAKAYAEMAQEIADEA